VRDPGAFSILLCMRLCLPSLKCEEAAMTSTEMVKRYLIG